MSPTTLTVRLQEKALVDRCVAGDEEAWRQLHRTYGKLLRLLAARALRQARMASTKEAVEDLVQDVLCGLLLQERQQLAKYDLERASLGRFLGLRVRDAVYDRSNQVKVRHRLQHERRLLHDLAGQQDGPELLDCVVREFLAGLTQEGAAIFRDKYLGEPDANGPVEGSSATYYRRRAKVREQLNAYLAAYLAKE